MELLASRAWKILAILCPLLFGMVTLAVDDSEAGQGMPVHWKTLNVLLNTEWSQAGALSLNFHNLFFIQIVELQVVRDQLCFSGLSSEVQPLLSERSGPDSQQAAGFRSEASLCWTGESKLSTGDSEVRHHFFPSVLRLIWCESCVDTKLQTSDWYYTDPHWAY